MKKKNVLNLIKYYSENNDVAFRQEACEIARDFNENGDEQLADYIMALICEVGTFVPQMSETGYSFIHKVNFENHSLPIPEVIKDDILGIINAIGHNVGINKFLFYGEPGTGKTETVKHVSRILSRDLYSVDFDTLIDCKLGQTSKNIAALFEELNNIPHPEKVLILFDEIDAIALDRTSQNDLREMGRATSSVLKGFDNLSDQIVVIATTNLYKSFDNALVRRFDSCIDFNRYSREDLLEISEIMLTEMLNKFHYKTRNMRLFLKIISLMDTLPYPGLLQNLIKTSIAFSDPNDETDYFRKLYNTITNDKEKDIKKLQEKGFTLREIEILTKVSKSQISRFLNKA